MEVSIAFALAAGRDAVLDYMLSPAYLDALVAALPTVDAIALSSSEERDDGKLERVLHYTAPTQLPGFLKRYEDRAPEHVHWDERGVWDRARGRYRYTIVPDIPESWHDRYEAVGQLAVDERGASGSEVTIAFTYKVRITGLSRVVERALRGEVDKILAVQRDVLTAHFGPG